MHDLLVTLEAYEFILTEAKDRLRLYISAAYGIGVLCRPAYQSYKQRVRIKEELHGMLICGSSF